MAAHKMGGRPSFYVDKYEYSKYFRPAEVKRSEIPIITIHHHGHCIFQ